MKISMSGVALALSLLALVLNAWLWLAIDSITMSSAKRVILDDTENFHAQVERELITRNRERFAKIYQELGVEYDENPSTIQDLLKPLGVIVQQDQDTVGTEVLPDAENVPFDE